MEEFLLNFFLADVFSTMALISLIVAGNGGDGIVVVENYK